jgi:hypothetical protein
MKGVEDAIFYKIDELKNTEDLGFWAKYEDLGSDYLKITDKWAARLKQNNITLKGITPDNPGIRKWMSEHGVIKHLLPVSESKYSAQISIDVTEKFVRIADAHALQFLIIENERIAKAVRQIFSLVIENESIKTKTAPN